MICCRYFKVLKVVWCSRCFGFSNWALFILSFFTSQLFGLFFKKFGEFCFFSSGHSDGTTWSRSVRFKKNYQQIFFWIKTKTFWNVILRDSYRQRNRKSKPAKTRWCQPRCQRSFCYAWRRLRSAGRRFTTCRPSTSTATTLASRRFAAKSS